MVDVQQQRVENLGPAERIIQTLIGFTDHLVHNRAGIVMEAANAIGVAWSPVTTVEQDGKTVVYKLLQKGAVTKVAIPGKEKPLVIKGVPMGTLWADKTVRTDDRRKVGEFRPAGLFPEVAVWMYRQVAEVWKLDNEFAAKWASYAYANDQSRDLKVVLAAFLMVQSRKGDPVLDGGVVAFHDDDFRDVGEAMALNIDKGKSLDAKLLLRVHSLLTLPGVAAINRELGFGRSARRPFLGRWPVTVSKWLTYREVNPQLLDGLVKAGFKETIKSLARKVGYKPVSEKFYETLRWKQVQAKDGRRSLAIGKALKQAESWEDLTEEQICERIVSRKLGYKVITGLLPKKLGLTRAIMAAAIEAGSLSNKDLVIATPTLEALGLLQVQDIRAKWQAATQAAEDQRSANIARNVKSKETKEVLQEAAEVAVQKAVAEVLRGLVIYFLIDISGSMTNAIEQAKIYIGKLLPAFPLDKIHIAVFNTVGREVKLKAASQAAVNQAFVGIQAGGGTSHGAGFLTLAQHKPAADEDLLVIVVGDEQDHPFAQTVRASGVTPVAFGLLKVSGSEGDRAVRATAAELGVPCFRLDTEVFEDPYAVPQRLRSLIAATPVGAPVVGRIVQRITLVEQVLATELLKKPAWAA
jgi:hypothetical protein